MKKIKINPTFYIIALLLIALGYVEQFFLLFFFTTLHELAHVLAAVIFKCTIKQIILLPIGEICEIDKIDNLNIIKKIIIIVAGPFLNILIAFIIFVFFKDVPFLQFILTINLSMGIFNLIPIFPLDGGRLLNILLGEMIGVLKSNGLIIKISKVLSIFIITLGIIQVILYPFNVSLILIGTYIMSINKKEQIALSYTFFKSIEQKNINLNENTIYQVRSIITSSNTEIKKIIKKISFNYYYIIFIIDNGKIKDSLTETNLVSYIIKNGITGTVNDIAQISDGQSF